MESLYYSFIIPVYNRPDEVQELLESLAKQEYGKPFEIVIVEDGSTKDSAAVVEAFTEQLQISYYQKPNSGPGDSRNYGMRKAKGNYFIVLDSDCIIPPQYLMEVEKEQNTRFVHCFGGPDAAHESFSKIQKAINYAMTSVLTTGGIRGNKNAVGKFQPRSFNMGISKQAFEATQGFGNIHPGEDPDLTFRIWNAGFETRLFSEAYVYHKRRIDWDKFKLQVQKFGMVRPILNKWHPNTAKITYWFPTVFFIFSILAVFAPLFGFYLPLKMLASYFIVLFVESLVRNKNLEIAFLSLYAVIIQFFGYGWGFLKSTLLVNFSGKEPEEVFPKLFFKN
ncbi:glycosyltransferase family 2 protein [Flavobacterium sp. ASW18X]|uniref:glycosyltransferase n=1 Tax=Flavobacterium sp. ASW18X TaxID=2572595 RepID=UPI0010AE6395|nr:glycosyltransferase [Flavobacterium sp. ASW18X]TKD65849.1 glycosyltransferase [Flavobacterium sp. ASW18X]